MDVESLRKEVGVTVRRVKTHLGLANYTKPQEYNVTFVTEIQNGDKRNTVEVVVPVPISQSNSYQSITELEAFPDTPQIMEEPKYGNRYAYWTGVMKPSAKTAFGLKFRARILPRDGYAQYSPGDLIDENIGNAYIDPKHPMVKELVRDLRQYKESGIRKFNRYVIDNLRYGDPVEGLYSVNDALTRDQVDCGGYATLLASLCIAADIPARILSGFWAGYPDNNMHAWLEVLLSPTEGGWAPLDPSIEQLFAQGRTTKYARVGYVGSDRIVLSRGSDLTIAMGGKKVPVSILQNPIILASQGKNSIQTKTNFITSYELS